MAYFSTVYTIHFDDTMAYGSHHFLTAFKFQCAARESFLFGEHIFDIDAVRECLDRIHLITADAYARNLSPAELGDRVAILLTLEEWGRASARFCYRVIAAGGRPVCAGFQTLICADSETGAPIPMPQPLYEAMESMREIEEVPSTSSFRDRVLAGGNLVDSLFGDAELEVARRFLEERHPAPQILAPPAPASVPSASDASSSIAGEDPIEAWVFAGQGAFDASLFCRRVQQYMETASGSEELREAIDVARDFFGEPARALLSDSAEQCTEVVKQVPDLLQVAIHLQNVLGASLRLTEGRNPAVFTGHSFGEIAAFGAGGCFDLPTGVRVVCERVRAIAAHRPPDGGLVVLGTDRQTAATEASLLGLDQIAIAGRNHDEQTVASGPTDQLRELAKYLRSVDIQAIPIASPTSFHHPQLRSAAGAWLRQLRKMGLSNSVSPVYSCIGRCFVGPGDDIPATLASHLLRPFDLQGGISDLINAGANAFVDCGSSGSLARILSAAGPSDLRVYSIDLKSDEPTPGAGGSTSSADRGFGFGATAADSEVVARPTPGIVSGPETAAKDGFESESLPQVAIVAEGCVLPGGASTPERLMAAIEEETSGIIDQRDFDPHWGDDFYCKQLVPDRSNSHLMGRVRDDDIVVPADVDSAVFDSFSRTQRLLCIALAPCIASLKTANNVLCLIGATADGFENQDIVASLRFAGIDPCDDEINQRMDSARWASQDPHGAIQEVFDRVVRPGIEVTLIDAACASSLYSVALGMRALESGQADVVITGGVFCPGPGNSCLFSQFRGLTSTGSRPFDAGADGVVFSEGAAIVALCRASHAEQHRLPVHAVVRGAGLSSDGRSSSANVPQSNGQILSLQRCYESYRIDPASIHAIECHGTSTPVGDSTELETLRRFFSQSSSQPIPVHSLKGLIGHAGWAAGTASIIAASQYIRQGRFPAQSGDVTPSEALREAWPTLTVPTDAVSLPGDQRRIAIDGFGFGGANAHVVLDSPESAGGIRPLTDHDSSEADLVVVAFEELHPTLDGGRRFDREHTTVPENYVLLPDLADDMDISQTLTVSVIDSLIAKVPGFDASIRENTAIVLAQSGKTDRGVAATMRVLGDRLRRQLQGLPEPLAALDAATARTRASGPYTLQCMMPNVASGRAALMLNLNGPNFVVDAGADSLQAALKSAALLLQGGNAGGTQVVVVAAVQANSHQLTLQELDDYAEFATAMAVTTRRKAKDLGLRVLSPLQSLMAAAQGGPAGATNYVAHIRQVESVRAALMQTRRENSTSLPEDEEGAHSEFPIHVPQWVETPLLSSAKVSAQERGPSVLLITTSEASATVLDTSLAGVCDKYRIVVIGSEEYAATNSANSNVIRLNASRGEVASGGWLDMGAFVPDVVLGLHSVTDWDFSLALKSVADENQVCEAMFLFAQRYAARLQQANLQLWALTLDGWHGCVHPASGAAAGTLKSIRREYPGLVAGAVATRGLSLRDALTLVLLEGSQTRVEPEIIWDSARRLVRRLRPAPNNKQAIPRVHLDADSVVVATGGAQGVTAVLVETLLQDHKCTAIAIGRSELEAGPQHGDEAQVEREFYDRFSEQHGNASPLEMRAHFAKARARWEAHQTIERLSQLGGHVEYLVADVTDSEQVNAAIQEVVDKFGRIDLLLHGAGVQYSKRLENRSLSEFRQTYSVKVSGLKNLIDAGQRALGETLTTHVLTSAYSIFGNDGQHDYGAANETLDRLCELQSATSSHGGGWSSIAWLAWDGVGMTRGSEYRVLAQQRALSGLSAHDGGEIFRQVLSGRTGAAINVPLSDAERLRYEVPTLPMLENSARRVVEIPLELRNLPCLAHHQVRDIPTLPGAWIIDRMVQAGMQLADDRDSPQVEVENVLFQRFVRTSGSGREPNLRVVAAAGDTSITAWVIGDLHHPSGVVLARDEVFANATLRFRGAQKESPSLPTFSTSSDEVVRVRDPYCEPGLKPVHLTGPFDCLRNISLGAANRWASFSLESEYDWQGVIPALLLDAAWRVGAMYAVPDQPHLYVPVRIRHMTLPIVNNAAAAIGCEIRTTAPRVEGENVRWDRTEVLNGSGDVVIVVGKTLAIRLD